MTQSDFNLGNQNMAPARTELNGALQAAATLSAGGTAPTTTYANQAWLDTSGAPWVLKIRNAANDAWISVLNVDDTDDKISATLKALTMTGAILVDSGAVGAPGVAFSGDPDTGMFRPSANQLALAAGGVQALLATATKLGFPLVLAPDTETLTSSTAISLDLGGKSSKELTLDHNTTITLSGAVAGQIVGLRIKQGSTGGTAAWAGITEWYGGAAPVLSTTTGEYDGFVFEVDSAGSVIFAQHLGVAA